MVLAWIRGKWTFLTYLDDVYQIVWIIGKDSKKHFVVYGTFCIDYDCWICGHEIFDLNFKS